MESITLEMTIDDIKVGKMTKSQYVPVTLDTNRGRVECRYYHIPGEKKAVIFVGGIDGGFDSPAKNLYTKLSQNLSLRKMSSLRLQYRYPSDLVESALDVLAGITFLERFGIEEIALVGHSFGGAVVIQAAAAAPEIVKTVVTLASQAQGAEAVSYLEETSILLIHGNNDKIFPTHSSTYIYDLANGPKELLFFDDTSHSLQESAKEVYDIVEHWLIEKMQ
jgi:pimeloyl-ACP methyl ester carboxylesterase